MRYSLLTLFAAFLLLAVSCKKDDDTVKFNSIEGGWFLKRHLEGSFAENRQTIFLKPGGQAVIFNFPLATAKYRYDGTYTVSGNSIKLTYTEYVKSGENFQYSDITMDMEVNSDFSYASGTWSSVGIGGVANRSGSVYMNQDAHVSESIVQGPFISEP